MNDLWLTRLHWETNKVGPKGLRKMKIESTLNKLLGGVVFVGFIAPTSS